MKSKAAAIIIAFLTALVDVYSAASGQISPQWAGIAGAGIALVYLAVRTLTKHIQGSEFKSILSTTEFWACVIVCLANLGLAIAGKAGWAQTGAIVVILGVAARVGISMGGTIPTGIKTLAIAIVAVSLITGAINCAWWQRNESKIACTGIVTVKNAPQLINVVNQCATIAVSWVNILPCIRSTVGTTWPDDVIACFAASQAGRVSCPAANTGKLGASLDGATLEKLKMAVDKEYKGAIQ